MKYDNTRPLDGFTYRIEAAGSYIMTYESDYDRKVGRYWIARVNDMAIIDATVHTYRPKRKDVEQLRRIVKDGEKHYRSYANKIRRMTKTQLLYTLQECFPWRASGFYGRYTKADIIASLK